MENEGKSAVEKFLLGQEESAQESQFALPDQQEEAPKEEQEEEKPLPFHRDPKIQKFIAKEIEKGLKSMPKPESPAREEKAEGDDYWARLIGNDTPEKVSMAREAKAREDRLLQQAEERAFARIADSREAEEREEMEAAEELGNAIEGIEEAFGVDLTSARSQKVRSDFLTYVERIAPKDRSGDITEYPDMTAAWETFSEISKASAQPSRAKQLASRGMAQSSGSAQGQPSRRVDWNSVDEMMDGLKG